MKVRLFVCGGKTSRPDKNESAMFFYCVRGMQRLSAAAYDRDLIERFRGCARWCASDFFLHIFEKEKMPWACAYDRSAVL